MNRIVAPGHRKRWLSLVNLGIVSVFNAGAFWLPTVGVFLEYFERDLGWSKTQIYLGVSFGYLIMPIAAPLIGIALDRGLARRVIIGSLLLQVALLAYLSVIGSHIAVYYGISLLMFVAITGVSPMPVSKLVTDWFDERRGMVFGIVFALALVGTMIAPVGAVWMIDLWGWRSTFLALACMVFVCAVIPAVVGVHDTGLRNPKSVPSVPDRESSIRALFFQREFVVLAVWVALYGYSYAGLNLHLIPILREFGLATAESARAQSALGFGALIGNVIAGLLLDRVHAPRLASLFALSALGGVALLISHPGPAVALISAVTIGVAGGSEGAVLVYLVGRYFPPAAIGRILGALTVILILGCAPSPVVAALLRDHFGGYGEMLALNSLTFALGGLISLRLKSYRN